MSSVRPINKIVSTAGPSPSRWITHVAFLLALVVVIGRVTTPDALRSPWEPIPGGDARGGNPGPATSLVFDLLALLPAIGVLLRRAIDSTYCLRTHRSHFLLLPLAGWAVLSTAWSADKFAAAVTAAHFFAAACFLWGMSQLVRSFARFRVVSAMAFGLLIVLVVQSLVYRYVDAPAMSEFFAKNKAAILRQQNKTEDSLPARMMEHNVESGQVVSFFKSPNSLAAVGVLLFFACVGIGIQKIQDSESREWLLLPAIAAGSLIWVLINARSKTSAATPFVGLALLAAFALFRDRLQANRRRSYFGFVGLIVITIFAVIGHGLYHHGLFPGRFSNSLDFRWKYWVASARMFPEHPWAGTGWENFGSHYLAHRLPEAAEEISDPHNFLVHFFIELGLIGGLLCIAWLLRFALELTTVAGAAGVAGSKTAEESELGVRSIVIVVLLGMLLNVLSNIDLNQPALDVLSLLMKPFLYTLAMLLSTLTAVMLSPNKWSFDTRPGPWIYYCLVTALGLFLLHNLIDFSWFEAGPMLLFMALAGAALGVTGETASSKHLHRQSRGWAIGGVVIGASCLAVMAIFFVAPVLFAEQYAAAGDEAIRTAPMDDRMGYTRHFEVAAADYGDAATAVPFNSDYLYQQARATGSIGNFVLARTLLAQARQLNPLQLDTYLLDAQFELDSPHPDAAAICSDFDAVVKLNPNDVAARLQYAAALEHLGLFSQARVQYRAALDADAALPIGEPKRLAPERVADLKLKAAGN